MIRTLLAGAATLALLGACSQSNDPADDAAAAVNATQDAASMPVGQASAATLGANTAGGFVTALATSDMYELAAADIANAKSRNAGVKELAGMIKTDHTASTAKLKTVAPTEAADTPLPTALDERRQGLIDNLNAAAPADFDRVFLTQQVAAHNEALTLLNGFKDHVDNPGPRRPGHRGHPQGDHAPRPRPGIAGRDVSLDESSGWRRVVSRGAALFVVRTAATSAAA